MERTATEPRDATRAGERITFEDYLVRYNSFEGGRTEWLGGEVAIYPMGNNIIHENIIFVLKLMLHIFVSARRLGRIAHEGMPMYLGDDRPAREPDLMVLLGEHVSRIKHTYVDGVADIVVEVVSPESDARDHGAKFVEYEAAGAPEYWLFDPLREDASVFALGADGRYHRVPLTAAGWLTSPLLPGFALDPAILWRERLPNAAEIVALVNAMRG